MTNDYAGSDNTIFVVIIIIIIAIFMYYCINS